MMMMMISKRSLFILLLAVSVLVQFFFIWVKNF